MPKVQAVYTSASPIFYSALMGAGVFVTISPFVQFITNSVFNQWSFVNFLWWSIKFSIAIYVLLIVLPDENLQKIFLWASHYIQGLVIALLFLNTGMFFETILIWMEDVDLSNVFKTESENIVRNMANLELFSTLPNIAYLFLVYFFIVDIREFYMNQDGTI